MLTPWVKPVTAGKKMANRSQKFEPPGGGSQFVAKIALSHLTNPPAKKEKSAATSRPITTYWSRVAQSAPNHAKTKRNETAAAPISWDPTLKSAGNMDASASPKPMQ